MIDNATKLADEWHAFYKTAFVAHVHARQCLEMARSYMPTRVKIWEEAVEILKRRIRQ